MPTVLWTHKDQRTHQIYLTKASFYRNKDAAERITSELKTMQPDAETAFIQKDLTLLKNVDEVCNEIKAKETKLNLLFMSQGTLSMKGRDGSLLLHDISKHP